MTHYVQKSNKLLLGCLASEDARFDGLLPLWEESIEKYEQNYGRSHKKHFVVQCFSVNQSVGQEKNQEVELIVDCKAHKFIDDVPSHLVFQFGMDEYC